jgi:type I restriction enzyme S subunit
VNPPNLKVLAEQIAVPFRHLRYLLEQIEWNIPKSTVWAFGSRVKWSHRPESDLDLAVLCDKDTARKGIPKLNDAFQESDLPFKVQIADFNRLPKNMQENIRKNYIVLYQPSEEPLPNGWKQTTLGEVAEINPSESLKVGTVAKYVAMQHLTPFTREITQYETKEFKGGSKFKNGDTLLARITPCLENGKTAFVDFLEENEVAFGSTEFIVIREKKGASDKNFLFYFALSPVFREAAIKSMTGTSGRQRVQTDLIADKQFSFPPLPEQKAIAAILSSFDDKIELLRRQNKTLESIAETIFKEWFIHFKIKNHKLKIKNDSGLPEGCRMGKLGDILELAYGKALKEGERTGKGYPVIGSSGIVGYHSEYLIEGFGIVIGRKGSMGTVIWIEDNFFPIDTTFYVVDKLGVRDLFFHYFILKNIDFQKIGSDSAVPGLNRTLACSLEYVIPKKEIIEDFNKTVKPIFQKTKSNNSQIQTLSKLRDTLLPKLMKGEIRLKDTELPVKEKIK